jgi:hypothetical protein
MQRNKNLFALILLVLSLACIAVHYLSGSSIQASIFNADALYLPTLFADILAKGGQIKDWYLTPAPYFFPDYPTFLLAYLIGPTPFSQMILFALIQVVLVFLAIWFTIRVTTNLNSFITATTIVVILTWLGLMTAGPFILILNSAYHYGGFLSSILLSALWIKFNSGDKNKNSAVFLSLMAILAYVSTLSDNLFLVQFIAPLIAIQVLASIAERDFQFKNKLPLILVVICSILGSISYKWIVDNQTRYTTSIGIDKLSSNLKDIYELFHSAIIGNPVLGFIFLIYIGVVLCSFTRLIRGEKENAKSSWLIVFSFLSLCTTLGATTLIENLPITSRYLIPVFSWPVIVVLIFLNNHLRDRFASAAIVISLLALASMSWTSYHLIKNNGIKTKYYPEDISCIDDALEKENLHNGIAQYWDAKYLQNFSRLRLDIAQHSDNLDEMLWITSKEYFKKRYDFAIISENAPPPYKISSEALTRINGAPKLVKTCGSRLVLMYGKDKMRVRKIVNVGDSYTWKACELLTQIGEKTAGCAIQKKDNAQSGYVTHGPYEPLETGQYTFEIAYSSTTRKGEAVGDWDVVLALPKEAEVLKNGRIAGTGGATEKIVGKFALDSGQNLEKIEIRTLARPHVDLKVIYIQIDRVQ